jgi:hypothetical protein
MEGNLSGKTALPRISGWTVALVLGPALVGLVVLIWLSRDALFVSQPPAERLPALPAPAAALAGVDTGYFFEANPYVQASDGQIYRLVWAAGESGWEMTPLPAGLNPGEACPENRQRPLAVAGEIVECRTVGTLGEWCPGPIVSFAITANGEVWRHNHQQPCTFPLIYLLLIFLPVLLAVGVFLAALRRIILRIRRRTVA